MYVRTAYLPVQEGTVAQIRDENYEKVSFVLDSSCENANTVLKEGSEHNKFRFVHNWFIISSFTMKRENVRNLLQNVTLRMDTDLKLAVPFHAERYSIFEIYWPGLQVDIKINNIGLYSNRSLTFFNKDASFYTERKNMSSVLIRTGNRVNYSFATPESYANELRHRQHFTFGKFHFQLFLHLVYIHEFHYNTTIKPEWFGNSSSGIEAGLSGLLWDNKIDISSAGGILRAPRMHYYDYLLPYYQFRTSFFFRNPGLVNPGSEVLKPFSLLTWYCFLTATVVVTLAVKASYWIERRFLTSRSNYSVFTSFVIIVSLFAQQGSSIVPTHLGGRIIFLDVLILSILLYNYYTSALVSSLLNSKPPVLETIRELYQSNLKIGTEYQPYTNTYIVQAKDNEWVQKLNSSKIFAGSVPNYYTPEDGLAKVKLGGFAYHTETTTAYPIISRTFEADPICDLAQIQFIDPASVGLMMPKKSQYRQLFLVSLVKMHQSGIFKRERDVWVASMPQCQSNLRVLSVGVNELFLVYIILVGGMTLAFATFCLEIVWYRLKAGAELDFLN
ncbi:hypothetical protein NQ315_001305 [Exocentrus adspersus]|uniref:Uncharacterized protein n=1 Tax=Exocentrus adspersus TaxID=1586481 RepID=A0AAV8WFD0_9CUCU|nr:hypothetical protein NQ315_001305 [Exocentrus adspersus]